jgi:hypothetical protein
MYQKNKLPTTTLVVNNSYAGERIEDRVYRMMFNNEPIGDGSPLIYTDRRNGVEPQYNIRTDRFDMALTAQDKITANEIAKRAGYYKPDEHATDIPPAPASGGANATT